MSKPLVGYDAKVTIKRGADAEITLLNAKYSLDKENKVAEAHNTTDGTRRVRGRRDASGSVEGFQDTTSAATAIETNLQDGDEVLLKLYTPGGVRFYSLTAIVSKLHIDTGVDDIYAWNFDYQLASGVVTDPVLTA